MALTPMMRQYFDIKEKCKDSILFFRLGDFYEMFFEDAEVAAKELELVLTGRDCGLDNRAPMCGIPFHAANGYIGRLISKGYKVAICEQVEDPAVAKGIVKRDIIKIITPGTYMDSSFLEDSKNNYVMSLYINNDNSFCGICFCDISTGEFNCTDTNFNLTLVLDEISKFNPKEILVSENIDTGILESIKERFNIAYTKYPEENFVKDSVNKLKRQFINFEASDYSETLINASTGLLNYVIDTQKVSLAHIDTIEYYNILDYLSIDVNSRRNLEISETLRDKTKKGSLLWVMDKTSTAMGARRLRKWLDQPLVDKNEIINRLDAVEEISKSIASHEELKETLKEIYDIERLVGKICSKSVNAKELVALKNSIEKLPKVKGILSGFNSKLLQDVYNNLDELRDIYKILDEAIIDNPSMSIKEGNIIKEGFNSEVDSLRIAKAHGKEWIATLENDEKIATGIKSLKVGYNKVFGYYIEITKSNLNSVPEGRYIRKQTLANAERYITPELKEMEDKILGAEEKLVTIEYDIFVTIREDIEKHIDRMKNSSKLVSELDCLSSLSTISLENNYCKPEINTKGFLKIEGGRHPVVEKMIPTNTFVDNDTFVNNEENQLLLITGPNMAGKSTYMRQIALITLMAQVGSFVPAKKADISICDKIFTRIGASDDLAAGKSTFMVEMWEVSNILQNATTRSLILLDEVGRGTSTYDGLSIAWSVIEYICKTSKLKCKTLFATHYHELTKLEGIIPGVRNYSIAVKKIENEIVFLRKIVKGGADESYGIEVAKLAGLPEMVIERAREILNNLENDNNSLDVDSIHSTLDNETSKENKEKCIEEECKSNNNISDVNENITEYKDVNVIEDIKENQHESNREKLEYKNTKKEIKEVAITKIETPVQLGFSDLEKSNLINEIKDIDILNMTPMDGFNKLFNIIKKAKNL